MREYEKKLFLTADEFLKILNSFPTSTKTVQTNFYYDTDDFDMNSRGITCRIRKKDGRYTATVKMHGADSAECSVETSRAATDEFDDRLFADKHVELRGILNTERYYLVSGEGLEAVLDRNTYLGCVDYELEVEYSPDKKKTADRFMRQIIEHLERDHARNYVPRYDIRMRYTKSKSARFFERLKKIQQKRGEHSDDIHFA